MDEVPFEVALVSEVASPEDFILNSGGGTYSTVSMRRVPKRIRNTYPGCGMYTGNEPGSITVVVVVIQ